MSYPSDLTDAEWQIIEPLLPPDKPIGRPPEVDLRDVMDAIFYRVDNGSNGEPCLLIFPHGKRSTPTIAHGYDWGFGNRSMPLWSHECEFKRDVIRSPVYSSAIVSP
jgi:Putative transposase of IS4/5 family (DUF4096)